MSEKKVTPNARIGNVAVAGLRDVLDDLRRVDLDDALAVRRVAEAILEEWEEIASATGGSVDNELSDAAARQDDLHQKRQQRGRHDGKRVPPGYAFDNLIAIGDESLAPSLYRVAGPERDTHRDIAIVRQILDYLGGFLPYAVPERETGILAERRDALESVFEALHGYPFGEQWRAALETELEWDAEAKVGGALRASHHVNPNRSAFIEPVSDEQFLIRMRMRVPPETEFPAELTSEKVAELRLRTALNKGGSKRPPRAVVQEFAESLRK